ncbi:MAG TPA: hypothetical protein VIQ76_14940 [Propionibacteriaceae bacterium]
MAKCFEDTSDWPSKKTPEIVTQDMLDAVYGALIAVYDKDARRLLDRRDARSTQELIRIVEDIVQRLTVGGIPLADQLRDLLRRSQARTRERVSAIITDVDAAERLVNELLSSHIVYDLQVRSGVTLVVADMGTGKSEACEAWHRSCVKSRIEHEDKPWPVWLDRNDLTGSLEDAIRAQVPGGEVPHCGVDVVLDKLDEGDAVRGAELLAQARIFANTYRSVRIVCAARPDIIERNDKNVVRIPVLDQAESALLIALLTGKDRIDMRGWGQELSDAASRPLFALLIADELMQGGTPGPPYGLVTSVILRALHRPTDRRLTQSEDLNALLRRLAVSSVSGLPLNPIIGDLVERSRLFATRLVIDKRDGSLSFALPLLEQFFAAQAIIRGEISLEEIASTMNIFGRWRYPLAFAVVMAQPEVADRLMSSVARWNPGAASWIVDQATTNRGILGRQQEEVEADKLARAMPRVEQAFRTWAESVGSEFTKGILRHDANGTVEKLHAWNDGRRIYLGLAANAGELLAPSWGLADLGMRRLTFGHPPQGRVWPWRAARDVLRSLLKRRLTTFTVDELLSDDPLAQELQWYALARFIGHTSPVKTEISVGPIIARLRDALAASPNAISLAFGRHFVLTPTDCQRLIVWLEERRYIQHPWPGPDQPTATGGWVWSLYTPEQLQQRTIAVYTAAVEIYRTISRTIFKSMGPALGLNALSPVKFVGYIQVRDEYPIMMHFLVPALRGEIDDISISLVDDLHAVQLDPRMAVDRAFARYASSPSASPFSRRQFTWGAVDIFEERPATRIAYQWLWSDLDELGWAEWPPPTGTFSIRSADLYG